MNCPRRLAASDRADRKRYGALSLSIQDPIARTPMACSDERVLSQSMRSPPPTETGIADVKPRSTGRNARDRRSAAARRRAPDAPAAARPRASHSRAPAGSGPCIAAAAAGRGRSGRSIAAIAAQQLLGIMVVRASARQGTTTGSMTSSIMRKAAAMLANGKLSIPARSAMAAECPRRPSTRAVSNACIALLPVEFAEIGSDRIEVSGSS